jgi:predicted Rossmann fold nucleotide-binding protein DprA/Smf involved in DNA uptake
MPTFPLSAPVAVVGSRYGSPFGVGQVAAAVVAAGGSVVTGCAAGVDSAAAAAASVAAGVRPARLLPPAYLALSALPRVLVCRATSRQPAALATRTRYVIAFASAVAVFPPAGGAAAFGPGSLLVLRLAQSRGVPVFVAGPSAPAVGAGWQAGAVAGVAGWLWFVPLPAQARLF